MDRLVNPMTTDSTQWLGPGFSLNNVTAYAFKKGLMRGNTSVETKYYQEPIAQPILFREYLASEALPASPPNDFVSLTNSQIVAAFGILESEIAQFQTMLNGSGSFSIQKSTSTPWLYKIVNCMLQPYMSNPMSSFSGYTFKTKVNVLKNTIPFVFSGGAYSGVFTRTVPESRELSAGGRDIVLPQQLPYVFDSETGIFTCYADDVSPGLPNPITLMNPPAITCYVYRGSFGIFPSDIWTVTNTTVSLMNRQLLIGKTTSNNPSLTMDVSGISFMTNIETQSLSTKSDRRLKENIVPCDIRNSVLDLEPKLYNYIGKADTTELGLIAQEVEEVVPELVRTTNGMKSLQYDRLGVLLLPIVKEQASRIRMLETEMSEMKEYMKTLLLKLGVV